MTPDKTDRQGDNTPIPLIFLVSWCLVSFFLVSFIRFHALGETALAFLLSILAAAFVVRCLPNRKRAWMVILAGGMAVVFSVYLEVYVPPFLYVLPLLEWVNSYQVSLGIAAISFLLLLLLSRRPAFSLLLCAIIVGGLVAISHTKYEYTGVPLLWLDLHLAASTWQFLLDMQNTETLLIQLAAFGLVIILWFKDRPIVLGRLPRIWLMTLFGGLVVSSSTLATGRASGDEILRTGWEPRTPDPWAIFIGSVLEVSDLREPAEIDPKICCLSVNPEHLQVTRAPAENPHVVVILEESTFPPELLSRATLKLDFFEQAYPMVAEVIGGGTWLAEYSLLHGVPPTLYGSAGRYINMLGPGRVDGRLPLFLKQNGYRTTTIYPVHHRFYGAATFHRSLGMDEFIDCREVPGCGLKMNAVHDARFFEVAERKLRASHHPAFIFLPTIRQHSPHTGQEAQTLVPCEGMTPDQCQIISIYADRLQDSVAEFNTFIGKLGDLDREVIVLAFGDHIPGDVAREFKESDLKGGKKMTFFTVWSSRRGYLTDAVMSSLGKPAAVNNAYLDLVIARAAGFNSPYFDAKEASLRVCSSTYCPNSREQP